MLLSLILLVPLLGAGAALVSWRWLPAQRAITVVASATLLCLGIALLGTVWLEGPVQLQVGGFEAPFGIRLRADAFSAIMVLVSGVLGLVVTIYALGDLDEARLRCGFLPLLLILLMGVCGAFLTADVFNLYVWFEVMLISSFVLLTLGSGPGQLRAGVIYVSINLLASVAFLIAVGLTYSAVRTLDMGQMAQRMAELTVSKPGLVLSIEALYLVAFGIKTAIFPLFFWLPASYHTPPPSISALFAGLLTKVGVYALIRISIAVFPFSPAVHVVLAGLAALTMLTGVLGALAQDSFRRVLSFHIISQIGYMVAGPALVGFLRPEARRFALAAGVFYIVHHIIVKTALFLVAGIVGRLRGSEVLESLGGLLRSNLVLGLLFLLPAMSLAGIPPLSGFWAKLAIVAAALEAEHYLIAAAAVVTGLLTLTSMTKIWNLVFWREHEAPADRAAPGLLLMGPAALLAALTVLIGFFPEPLMALAGQAADHLLAGADGLLASRSP